MILLTAAAIWYYTDVHSIPRARSFVHSVQPFYIHYFGLAASGGVHVRVVIVVPNIVYTNRWWYYIRVFNSGVLTVFSTVIVLFVLYKNTFSALWVTLWDCCLNIIIINIYSYYTYVWLQWQNRVSSNVFMEMMRTNPLSFIGLKKIYPLYQFLPGQKHPF